MKKLHFKHQIVNKRQRIFATINSHNVEDLLLALKSRRQFFSLGRFDCGDFSNKIVHGLSALPLINSVQMKGETQRLGDQL
jgi:hypothetical protein